LRKRCPWIEDHKPWTQAEEDFLRTSRGTMTAAAMAAALPGRTRDAVQSRCQQLGIWQRDLRPPKPANRAVRWWTTREIAVLHQCAGEFPEYLQAKHFPGRTEYAIKNKMRDLGIPTWTAVRRKADADLQVAA
jgi:hypothetical protein